MTYLNGGDHALPEEDIRTLREIQRFLRRHLRWASPQDVDDQFRAFLQDLIWDRATWPERRLPQSKRAFKGLALDYAVVGLYGLRDDEESKAITKAQNLRKLWSVRAHLRKTLQQEPTSEQLAHACRHRYGWSQELVERLLELERSRAVSSWDERWPKRAL